MHRETRDPSAVEVEVEVGKLRGPQPMEHRKRRYRHDQRADRRGLPCAQTFFYTPQVGGTLKALREDVQRGQRRVDICIQEGLPSNTEAPGPSASQVELIVVDEAERLSATSIEWLRDHHDRTTIVLILIGMPGIEKQFARYPQLYSRIGFAHHYRPLGNEELLFGVFPPERTRN